MSDEQKQKDAAAEEAAKQKALSERRDILRKQAQQLVEEDPEAVIEIPSREEIKKRGYNDDAADIIISDQTFLNECVEELKSKLPPVKKQKGGKFIVTGHVKHDDEYYKDGEPIDLDAKTAEQLLSVGAVREFRKKDS